MKARSQKESFPNYSSQSVLPPCLTQIPVPPVVIKKPKPKEEPKETASSVTKGQLISLPSPIVFQKGKSSFESNSFKSIQYVIKYVKEHTEIKKLNIQATVGDASKPSDNEDLAFARADAILEFFVNAGVEPKRLSSSGKVSSKPGIQNVDFIIQDSGGKK